MKSSKQPTRKITVKPKTTSRQIMNINSRIRKIKRNIKRINNLFILMVVITIIPYSTMFADWCKEISSDSTYFSVIGMLILSYLMLCGIIYIVTVNSVIEEKYEKIAYLEIEKAELMRHANDDTIRLMDKIKFRNIISQSNNIMED